MKAINGNQTILFQRARNRLLAGDDTGYLCEATRLAPHRLNRTAWPARIRRFCGAGGSCRMPASFHPRIWLSCAMDGTTADDNPTGRKQQSTNHRNSKSWTEQSVLVHAAKLFAGNRVLSAFLPVCINRFQINLRWNERDGR